MKKIKLIGLIVICLLATGCTVEYNINIKKDKINEKITINEQKVLLNEAYADERFYNALSEQKASQSKSYNVSKLKENDRLIYTLEQSYDLYANPYIRAFDECFDAYNIVYTDESEENVLIQTSQGFRCMTYEYLSIDTVKINITLDKEVIEHNADYVDNNTYTWEITLDNMTNKYISIEFKSDLKENSNFVIAIMFLVIGVGIWIFVIVYIWNEKKKQ